MLALTLELLGGRYIATAYNDRNAVEWPPHPARLFSALVATWADGAPESPAGEEEMDALRWLEQQPAPHILASEHCAVRTAVKVYVPVNDVSVVSEPDRQKLDEAREKLGRASDPRAQAKARTAVEKLEQKLLDDTAKVIARPTKAGKGDAAKGGAVLPDGRTRQERTFPSATPELPRIGFVWPDAEVPPRVTAPLTRLLHRLVRLGHSSTLVRATLASSDEVAALAKGTCRYVPDEDRGTLVIRWVGMGQTEQLQQAFAQHRETEPRVLPTRFFRYSVGETPNATSIPAGVFEDDFIVFARVAGPRLPIVSAAGVSRQFRRALISHAEEPIHEMLSGHRSDSSASESPHLMVVPLPVVSGPYPDGALIGLGLVLPRACDAAARRSVMRAIGRFEQAFLEPGDEGGGSPIMALELGQSGVLRLQRVAWGEDRRSTLEPRSWTRPSRTWASVTPVALDKNPGDLHHMDGAKRAAAFDEAARSVVEAVRRIGLPVPVEVQVVRSCVIAGTARPLSYPRFPSDEKRPQRVLVHVRLVFAEPVKGPIVLGAGRYQGLGLCLPIEQARAAGEESR